MCKCNMYIHIYLYIYTHTQYNLYIHTYVTFWHYFCICLSIALLFCDINSERSELVFRKGFGFWWRSQKCRASCHSIQRGSKDTFRYSKKPSCRSDFLELQSNNSADGFRHVYPLCPFLERRTFRDCEVLSVFSSVSSFSFLSLFLCR